MRALLSPICGAALVLAIALLAGSAFGVRAALDYTFKVTDGEKAETITCDNCSYLFKVVLFLLG